LRRRARCGWRRVGGDRLRPILQPGPKDHDCGSGDDHEKNGLEHKQFSQVGTASVVDGGARNSLLHTEIPFSIPSPLSGGVVAELCRSRSERLYAVGSPTSTIGVRVWWWPLGDLVVMGKRPPPPVFAACQAPLTAGSARQAESGSPGRERRGQEVRRFDAVRLFHAVSCHSGQSISRSSSMRMLSPAKTCRARGST